MATFNVLFVLLVCSRSALTQPTLPDFPNNKCGKTSDIMRKVEMIGQQLMDKLAEVERRMNTNINSQIGELKSEMAFMKGRLSAMETFSNTLTSEVDHRVRDTINNSTKQLQAGITEQLILLEERTMLALKDMDSRIHSDLHFLKNNTNFDCHLVGMEKHLKTSCAAIHLHQPCAVSGVHTIYPGGRAMGLTVWCDMGTDGGGWTAIQRREDGSVQFNQTWAEYKRGFGSPSTEFWIGNDALHQLTAAEPCVLRVDLWDWRGVHRYALYDTFAVGGEATNYTLTVSGYSGNAGDSLDYHSMQQFSTKERDHDGFSVNCAAIYGGGWWYKGCFFANLNGRYDRHGAYTGGISDGVEWYHWRGAHWYSLKTVTMMIKPRD